MKKGSFDKYILESKPEVIDSKFGQFLRNLMKEKKRNPLMVMPYIPRSYDARNNKRTKKWQHKEIPSIYMPHHMRMKDDITEYYMKTPQEMSRKEIQELEKQIQDIEEFHADDPGQEEEINLNLLKENKEFVKF